MVNTFSHSDTRRTITRSSPSSEFIPCGPPFLSSQVLHYDIAIIFLLLASSFGGQGGHFNLLQRGDNEWRSKGVTAFVIIIIIDDLYIIHTVYIAGNFRGVQFSRKGDLVTFRGSNFADALVSYPRTQAL